MNNLQIYNAQNEGKATSFIDVLGKVSIGGYIWASGRFIKKTGWRSSKFVDFRHIDREPHCAELIEYAVEMSKASALYLSAIKAIAPMHDTLQTANAFNNAWNDRQYDEADYCGAGWQ